MTTEITKCDESL